MSGPLQILLVEDDLVDIKSVRRALRAQGSASIIDVVPHGEAALEYLRGNGSTPPNGGSKRPSLILLDLSMPKMDGFEFLQALKSDEEFRSIPVIVLTTSRNTADVERSFALCAAGYFVKPIDTEEYHETLRAIERYWQTSMVPEKRRNGV